MTEEWREIKDYPNYLISNLGRVKSLARTDSLNRVIQERILKQCKNNCDYLQVPLWKDGKVKWFKVHRLVYQTFVGEIPEGMQVNHIDENKENNRVENLNLMTCKQNINWGTRNQKVAEKLSKEVIQFDLEGNELAKFPSANEVQRQLGFSKGNISKCCNGRLNHAYGYVWCYS